MLKKLAAGEILGESAGVCVWAAENGFGDVRLTALPGWKVTGSKLVRALMIMPIRLHVHNLGESAENKEFALMLERQFCSGCQICDACRLLSELDRGFAGELVVVPKIDHVVCTDAGTALAHQVLGMHR